jgi:hypothetical protein
LFTVRFVEEADDVPRHQVDEHFATPILQERAHHCHGDVRPSLGIQEDEFERPRRFLLNQAFNRWELINERTAQGVNAKV